MREPASTFSFIAYNANMSHGEEKAKWLFQVADVIKFRSGFTIVVSDCPIRELSDKVMVGDALEFCNPDGEIVTCPVGGIPLVAETLHPERAFEFILPKGTEPTLIKVGAEEWKPATHD